MPKPRKARALRNQMGHPARKAAQGKRYNNPPSPEELEIRELVRLVRREASADSQERSLVGPLAAASKHAAVLICKGNSSIDSDLHRHGVENYLTEQLGEVLDTFNVSEYLAWREECVHKCQT